MKVRIVNRPTGLLNGQEWPEVGEEFEVPDEVGKDMCSSGIAEPVAQKKAEAAEKRPAAKRAEKR